VRYLLDTNIVIPYLAGDPAMTALVATLAREGVAVSAVTLMEAWQGIYRGANPQEIALQYQRVFDSIVNFPFDEAIAKRCAKIRHDLKQQGFRTRERALDLQIAATAIEYGLELVTRNTDDYTDIAGLTLSRH
jgi:predicted nucleic acid-binding protein